jgi:26S proteasome regulatory subunit T6
MSVKVLAPSGPGLQDYMNSKIEELEFSVRDKSLNLKRLEAQRNKLNTEGADDFGLCA